MTRAGTGQTTTLATRRELFGRFLRERDDPAPFYQRLAERTIEEFPFALSGQSVLDLGSGPGHYSRAMSAAGATVVATDVGLENVSAAGDAGLVGIAADGARLPFAAGSFDGVFCSNLLEHVPDPAPIIAEVERVLAEGGWAWISWTNWYSPWGGHMITPFHYLGPRLGSRVHERLKGPPVSNPVFAGLWPAHIGPILRMVRSRQGLRLLAAIPRYYPSQSWIVKVPLMREFVTWNCLLLLLRCDGEQREMSSPRSFDRVRSTVTRQVLGRSRSIVGTDRPLVANGDAALQGISNRITRRTELVIDGFPRSGQAFATAALRHAGASDLEIASHLRAPSQLLEAVRRYLPTIVVIRHPVDAVSSSMLAEPEIDQRVALRNWIDHYRRLWTLRHRFVVATFDQVMNDFGNVIERVNRRFGTGFPSPNSDPRSLAHIRRTAFAADGPGRPQLRGPITRPPSRSDFQSDLRALWDRAEHWYDAFGALAV